MLQSQMPPSARVWVYQADRFFSAAEKEMIQKEAEDFLRSWTSHNEALPASYELKYDLFLILIANEEQVMAGGCSIDKSVHFIQSLGKKMGVDFMNRMLFAFRNGNDIRIASRQEFESLISAGTVHDETIVFNNLVGTIKELELQWEIPFKQSWHKQLV